MSETTTFTIGKVVKQLQTGYPGLTVSKVRFLEAEGLITPQRTSSGYRLYTQKDIDRLAAILRLQEKHFYPLQVIKEKLSDADKGVPVPELDGLSDAQAGASDAPGAGWQSKPLDEAAEELDVPLPFIRQLAQAGLIGITRGKAGTKEQLAGEDVPVITAAWGLKKHGIEPRILKQYVQMANRELPMFRQILSSLMASQGSVAFLEDSRTRSLFDCTLEQLLKLSSSVREGIICREIQREFNYPH